jgi:hypothetical protein
MLSPTEVLAAILDRPTDIAHVRSLVTPDVTYVSLNYSNPDLKRIMILEDTFATSASFRSGGSWTFESDPNGERAVI